MTTRTIAAVLLVIAGADATFAQDDAKSRIQARLNQELADALAQARKKVFDLALAELEVARSEARVDGLANNLVDDPLHNRLKKLLLSKEGKDLVREFMGEQGAGGLDQIVDQYFEKAKNGRLRVREDFEEVLEQLLDSVAPVEAPNPAPGKDAPLLGFKYTELAPGDRMWAGIPGKMGIKITDVVEGGPAAKAGLKKEDLVLSINSKQLNAENVDEVVKTLPVKTEFAVNIHRNRSKQALKMTLDERRPK